MPFGMDISTPPVSSPQNFYLYNNKELQSNTQLYDYGARFYDPVVGRFITIDPLAEKNRRYSTYNYGVNNPIRFIDIDGMNPDDYYTKTGEYLGSDGAETNDVRVIDKATYNNIVTNTDLKIMIRLVTPQIQLQNCK